MIIFVDFDDVLFNTKQYKEDLKKIFLDKGVSSEVFDKHYYDPEDESVVRNYEPKDQLRRIEEEEGISTEGIYEEVEKFIDNSKKYLFDDAYSFLDTFNTDRVFIISYGNTHSQRLKINNCEVAEYCRRIEVTDEMKSGVMEKMIEENWNNEDKIFFVEDRVEQIEDVKRAFPFIKTILMRREDGRYHDEQTKHCDYVAKDLKEAEEIIKSS